MDVSFRVDQDERNPDSLEPNVDAARIISSKSLNEALPSDESLPHTDFKATKQERFYQHVHDSSSHRTSQDNNLNQFEETTIEDSKEILRRYNDSNSSKDSSSLQEVEKDRLLQEMSHEKISQNSIDNATLVSSFDNIDSKARIYIANNGKNSYSKDSSGNDVVGGSNQGEKQYTQTFPLEHSDPKHNVSYELPENRNSIVKNVLNADIAKLATVHKEAMLQNETPVSDPVIPSLSSHEDIYRMDRASAGTVESLIESTIDDTFSDYVYSSNKKDDSRKSIKHQGIEDSSSQSEGGCFFKFIDNEKAKYAVKGDDKNSNFSENMSMEKSPISQVIGSASISDRKITDKDCDSKPTTYDQIPQETHYGVDSVEKPKFGLSKHEVGSMVLTLDVSCPKEISHVSYIDTPMMSKPIVLDMNPETSDGANLSLNEDGNLNSPPTMSSKGDHTSVEEVNDNSMNDNDGDLEYQLEKMPIATGISRETDPKRSSENSYNQYNLVDNLEKEIYFADPSISEELEEMINPKPSSNLNMTSSVVKSTFKASKVESVDSCAKPFSKSSWEENFKALVVYKDEHGHINLKTTDKLYGWLHLQRHFCKIKAIKVERMKKLVALGLQWKKLDKSGTPKHGQESESTQGSKSERMSWNESFHELFSFLRFHGHTNLQEDSSLKAWMMQQRVAFRKSKLSQERFEKLNAIEFDLLSERDKKNLNYSDVDWNGYFEKLTEFYQRTGNTNVKMADDMSLFHWLYRQRQALKDGSLPSDRNEKLATLGISNNSTKSDIDDSTFTNDPNFEWYSKFQELKQHKSDHGHLLINPDSHPDLANWVLEQQLSFKQGSLSSFKTKKLYNIGVFLDNESAESFCDIESETINDESQLSRSTTKQTSSSDKDHLAEWNSMFAKLEAFKESRGHVTVLLSDDVELHHWLQEQQRLYHKCILNVSHFEQLDQMGVDWSYSSQQETNQDPLSVSSAVLSDSIWDAKFKELTSFYEAHGHMYPPKIKDDSLRRWVYWQRHLHKSQKLEKWRNKKLSTLQSEWWLSKDESSNGSSKRDLSESSNIEFTDVRSQRLSKAWWARFKEFKAYISQTEDNYRKLDNSLYMWAYQQRLKYKEGKLESERVDALNSIGFEWKMSKRRRTEVTCDDFTPNRIEGSQINDRPLIGSTFISIHRGTLTKLIEGITHEKIDVPEILFHLQQMQHG